MKARHIWLVCILVLVAGGVIYSFLARQQNSLTYEGTELTGEAPDFQLTNQHGSVVELSNFRGKVIVLTFMDSKCQDTCPLTAAQFRKAYRQLDIPESDRVVFIGVNVNVEANGLADIQRATQTWHLDEIPAWHFLTGNPADLRQVWRDYGVAVVPSPDSNEEILHTPGTYIVDLAGQKRWYISTPFSAEGAVEWILPLSDLLVNHIRDILGEKER